jgi:capsule polysaccharide export protein KpsC/LpsZ
MVNVSGSVLITFYSPLVAVLRRFQTLCHKKHILLDGLPFDSKGAVGVDLLSNSWRGNDKTCEELLASSILLDEETIPAAVVARATKDTTLTRIAIDLTLNQYKGEQNKGVNFNSQGLA